MNIKKLICLVGLGFTSLSFAAQDYYDFKWELKRMEEKEAHHRDPSEFKKKNADGDVIELKNDPIVFEVKDDVAVK